MSETNRVNAHWELGKWGFDTDRPALVRPWCCGTLSIEAARVWWDGDWRVLVSMPDGERDQGRSFDDLCDAVSTVDSLLAVFADAEAV